MAPRKTPTKAAGGEGVVAALSPSRDINQSDLQKWVAEGKRLFAEAEARIESGEFLPALSSLAALPPLHGTLCERLSDIVNSAPQEADESTTCGMYL